jgi:tetrapyrrole methylase family protein/MazG family protein
MPSSEFADLLEIVKKLRSPEGGCPWDQKQTHESIRLYLLEEAHEALEAIQERNCGELKKELGDILFQVIFHAQIAEESDEFTISDVIGELAQKLKTRHPHVFGDVKIKTAEEQTLHWDQLKLKEANGSLLSRVPKGMPALLQSAELQERAHRSGFKWTDISGVKEKLQEELEEFEEAQESGNRENLEEELGDVLFVLTHLATWLDLSAEEALLKANQRFRKRFEYLEKKAVHQSKQIADFSLEQLDQWWKEAKHES